MLSEALYCLITPGMASEGLVRRVKRFVAPPADAGLALEIRRCLIVQSCKASHSLTILREIFLLEGLLLKGNQKDQKVVVPSSSPPFTFAVKARRCVRGFGTKL